MKEELIEFLDGIREYVRESNTNLAYDDRESSEFVEIYLKTKGEKLPKHVVSNCSSERADKLEERINQLGKHLGYAPMS